MMGGKAARNMWSRNTNKTEFSASVGFIHKEFVTMHGHMILKMQEAFSNQFVLITSSVFAVRYR